jgi:hypothetical protein
VPQPDPNPAFPASRCTQLRGTIAQTRSSIPAKRAQLGTASITDSQEQQLIADIQTAATRLARQKRSTSSESASRRSPSIR